MSKSASELKRIKHEQQAELVLAQLREPMSVHWECTGCGFDVHDESPPAACPKCNRGRFERIMIKLKKVI